jgi:hypothetical protein
MLGASIELPTSAIKQHWHEHFHYAPANPWRRSMIADLFLE